MNSEMEEGKEDLPNNYLPGFITMDILSRLPTKSLMKFRCVSKSWKTLVIHNPLFVNMHLNRSIKENIIKLIVSDVNNDTDQLYLLKTTELYLLEYKEKSDRCGSLVATKLHQLRDWIKFLGSCNGLLCTMAKEYCSNNKIVYPLYIWNPSTRDYKQVPCTSSKKTIDWQYGFGYSRKINDYKIIKVKRIRGYQIVSHTRVDVYSLRDNFWRKLPNIPYILWDCKSGELINDCLHWLATGENDDYYYQSQPLLIIAFDIGDETFCEVPSLPDISTGAKYKLQLTVFEMQLCMVNIDKCGDTKVWVMKEYGVKESWTMLFNIHPPGVKELGLELNLLGLTNKGSVLITGDTFGGKKKVFSYDPKSTKRYNLQIKGLTLPKEKIEEKIEGLLRGTDRARTYMESTVGVSINNWH